MDFISSAPFIDASLWDDYRPGIIEQDIITLPMGGALLYMMGAHNTSVSRPQWPFQNEHADRPKKDTRHPKITLALVGGGVVLGTFGSLTVTDPAFALWPAVSGLVHTHLITELATGFAKRFWLRRRPFYHHKLETTGRVAKDDSYSFFSGHSSHGMAFAAYMSHLLHGSVDNPWISWSGSAALVAAAAWVGSARAIDGQHNWSDVLTGAAVGGLIATYVAYKVDRAQIEAANRASRGFSFSVGLGEFTANWRF